MKRVLLIEDEKSLRLLIKMNLELEGYEVDQAQNGKEALRMFENAYYDIAVLDLMLPKVCLLYTSPSPRDATLSRMPSSA